MKRAIVHLSTRKYGKGRQRLWDTLFNHTDADLLFYIHEEQVGAPFHTDSKYAFKPFALYKARKLGYETVLWLDASMYVRRDLAPLFEEIEHAGYFFQDSGWSNERWTTAEQAEYFGTCHGTMISSGVVGLSFKHEVGNRVLDQWLQAAKDGMFNGSHEVTRHDQTALSLIIEKEGLSITENNTYWSYGKPEGEYGDNILILADGIV